MLTAPATASANAASGAPTLAEGLADTALALALKPQPLAVTAIVEAEPSSEFDALVQLARLESSLDVAGDVFVGRLQKFLDAGCPLQYDPVGRVRTHAMVVLDHRIASGLMNRDVFCTAAIIDRILEVTADNARNPYVTSVGMRILEKLCALPAGVAALQAAPGFDRAMTAVKKHVVQWSYVKAQLQAVQKIVRPSACQCVCQ